MDRHSDVFIKARPARIHPACTVQANGFGDMHVAEVPDVIGEEIDRYSQRLHPLEQRPVDHLTVLQRVAMVTPIMQLLRPLNSIDRDDRRFVAICVDVHLHVGFVKLFDQLFGLFRRNHPNPVRGAVSVPGPA